MKRLLLILILTFSLQSWTKADDISDFQIEGMSIGDSALDFFSENKIIEQKQNFYKNKTYTDSEIFFENNSMYHSIHVIYKTNDKNYIMKGLEATILYVNNINKCYKKLYEIELDLAELFKNTKKIDKETYKHPVDTTGKSTIKEILYDFKSGDTITLACYDWSKEQGYADHLRIALRTKKYNNFLLYKAFK